MDRQFSKLGSLFGIPNIVRHPCTKGPHKRDPSLESYPDTLGTVGLRV